MPPESLEKLTIDKSKQFTNTGKKRGFRFIIVSLLFLSVLALIFFVSKSRKISIETSTVSQIYPTQSFTLLNASGYVVAQRKAAVSSKITGRLEWLGVEEGSKILSGQVIARLENRDLEANVKQAEASVQNAKASLEQALVEQSDASQFFKRQSELFKQGIIAQSDFDVSNARMKRANALVRGAEAAVRSATAIFQGSKVAFDYSMIRAPFDAIVLTKNADVGDIITPLGAAANAKAAVFTIADMRSLQVEADVSESSLDQVKKGQPCEIMLDALPGSRFRGVINTIVPTADRTKASVMVKVRFIDSDIRILPEMSAKVAFLQREAKPEDQKARIAINPGAIVKLNNLEGVWLVKGDQIFFTQVVRGAKLGDLIEVSGLKSGDKIAIRPLEKLRDGSKIMLSDKK